MPESRSRCAIGVTLAESFTILRSGFRVKPGMTVLVYFYTDVISLIVNGCEAFKRVILQKTEWVFLFKNVEPMAVSASQTPPAYRMQ